MATRRSRRADAPPDGFTYVADFLEAEEERSLIGFVESLPFEPVIFRGVEARRRVVHLGHRYDFEARGVSQGLPIPPPVLELRDRIAPIAERPAERFVEVLATEYQPGATIGWHRDAPAFGSTVLGISLGSPCRMRFRRESRDPAGGWETWETVVEPRSVYLLSGAARATWQHSIPPTPDLRYSLTFRTLRHRAKPGG